MRTIHFGLRVTDLDRSIAFYEAVGYEVVGRVAETPIGELIMLKLPEDGPVAHDDRLSWLVWAASVDGLWAPTPAQLTEASATVADTVSEAIRGADGNPSQPARREPSGRELRARALNAAADRADREQREAAEASCR